MADETLMSSDKQRSWCVSHFLVAKRFTKIQAEFLHEFDTYCAPSKSRFQHWMRNFPSLGLYRTSTPSLKTVGAIQDGRGSEMMCQTLSISWSTMFRVICQDLKQFPNKIQTFPKLSPADMRQIEIMATVLMHKIENNKKRIVFKHFGIEW